MKRLRWESLKRKKFAILPEKDLNKRRRLYIEMLCEDLKLSENVKEKAERILEKIEKNIDLGGKNPRSIVASIVYIASTLCKEKRTQEEVTDTMRTCLATMHKYNRIVEKYLPVD